MSFIFITSMHEVIVLLLLELLNVLRLGHFVLFIKII